MNTRCNLSTVSYYSLMLKRPSEKSLTPAPGEAELVEQYTPLLYKIMLQRLRWHWRKSRKSENGAYADELKSELYMALLKGIRTYEPNHGASMLTYLYNGLRAAAWRMDHARSNGDKVAAMTEYVSHYNDKIDVMACASSDPDDAEHADHLRKNMDAAKRRCLTERERLVIDSRFGGGVTLQDVGDALGISKERVRQIQRRALEKLRRELKIRPVDSS